MTRYAERTSVSAGRSKAEIEDLVTRYGATGFASAWQGERAMIGFVIGDRQIRFVLPMPDSDEREFTHEPTRGRVRSPEAQAKAYDQAVRQRWRALLLVLKAKFEAIEAGIVVFDDEFLSHIVLPDGKTVSETIGDGIRQRLEGRPPVPLLPDYREGPEP